MVHCPLQIREKDLNISGISFHPHMKLIIKQIPIKMTEYHPQTFAEQQLVWSHINLFTNESFS